MALSFLLVVIITAAGLAVTYLIESEEPLLWRLAAGCVIGSAIFGTISFLAACFFGFGVAVLAVSLVLTLSSLAIFRKRDLRAHLQLDWQRAKGKLQGANTKKFLIFGYYASFAIVLWLFFEQAMFEMPDGIYTGGSHNLGDLPFHLGAIFSFIDGANLPPQNPSFAGAKFSYPFIADLLTACFVKLGTGIREGMLTLNFAWSLSLLVVLDRFIANVTGEKYAGKIAAFLLFFCGGLGFIWFVGDFQGQGGGLWDFLGHLPRDYSIDKPFSWGNSLVTLFITQRSILLGMPLTIVVLTFLWKVFSAKTAQEAGDGIRKSVGGKAIVVGLIAGCLPLIHLHSLGVLFVVTLFLLVIRPEKWRVWIGFGIGVCIVALPELAWSITGSASKATEFIGWHFGWDAKDENIAWFWIRNTGLVIPLVIGGALACYYWKPDAKPKRRTDRPAMEADRNWHALFWFYLPFVFLFVVANITKLAPWEWDNIKVLIYWFVGSLPLISLAIIWLWRQNTAAKALTIACLVALTASGALDIWRTISGQIKYKVFDRDAVQLAEQIKKATPANAVLLNAPTYNTAVVLSGRLSVMRFPGHLWSHGIDYGPRETDLKRMYAGEQGADELLRKYGVDYVLISPDEKNSMKVNEDFFRKFPVAADTGRAQLYKIR